MGTTQKEEGDAHHGCPKGAISLVVVHKCPSFPTNGVTSRTPEAAVEGARGCNGEGSITGARKSVRVVYKKQPVCGLAPPIVRPQTNRGGPYTAPRPPSATRPLTTTKKLDFVSSGNARHNIRRPCVKGLGWVADRPSTLWRVFTPLLK